MGALLHSPPPARKPLNSPRVALAKPGTLTYGPGDARTPRARSLRPRDLALVRETGGTAQRAAGGLRGRRPARGDARAVHLSNERSDVPLGDRRSARPGSDLGSRSHCALGSGSAKPV